MYVQYVIVIWQAGVVYNCYYMRPGYHHIISILWVLVILASIPLPLITKFVWGKWGFYFISLSLIANNVWVVYSFTGIPLYIVGFFLLIQLAWPLEITLKQKWQVWDDFSDGIGIKDLFD